MSRLRPGGHVSEVRRLEDGELCGYVRRGDDGFEALTVFYGVLGEFSTSDDAQRQVTARGLASLHERWEFRVAPDTEWQTVLIQEARPGWVRLVLGYYSLPGVPTVTVEVDEACDAELRLGP
jgi:hypothetical protein